MKKQKISDLIHNLNYAQKEELLSYLFILEKQEMLDNQELASCFHQKDD